MMNKSYFSWGAIILCILTLLHSCKKDSLLFDKDELSKAEKLNLIQEAQAFFEKEVLVGSAGKGTQLSGYNSNIVGSLVKETFWNKSKIRRISLGNAVITPLTFSKKLFIKTDKNSKFCTKLNKAAYIMTYKDGHGTMKTEVVIPIADDNYISNLKKGRKTKFSGRVLIYNWDGTFVKGYSYTSGGIHKVALKSGLKGSKGTSTSAEHCWEEATGQNCWWENESGNPDYSDGPNECEEDEGNSPNPEDEDPECQYTGEPTVTYVEHCETIYETVCEDDGEEDPNDTNDEDYDNEEGGEEGEDIKENIKDGCIEAAYDRIADDLENHIQYMLNDVFGQNGRVNLKVKDVPGLAGPAQTQVLSRSYDSNGQLRMNVLISLNRTTLPSKSQEYVCTTIIHEIVHAYLDEENINLNNQFQQHLNIAEEFVDDMRASIQDAFPNLSDHDANALILNGLGDIDGQMPAYFEDLAAQYNLTPQDIFNTTQDYKQGGTDTSKGNYCE